MKIIFDLKDVDYILSSFIRVCVNVAKQAGAGQFSVVHCQPFRVTHHMPQPGLR